MHIGVLFMNQSVKVRLFVLIIFFVAAGAAFFDFGFLFHDRASLPSFLTRQFTLGLDVQGGVRLLYHVDTSKAQGNAGDAMDGLRSTIERRVNAFGVSEPVVQVERRGDEYRLAVELAGVFDIKRAIEIIGETPFLEFRELNGSVPETHDEAKNVSFVPTGLDGKFLNRAYVTFDQTTGKPQISLEFNGQGADLFGQITKRNVGKPVGIFLDGTMLSDPIVQQEITGGKAQITGQFDVAQARELARYLNSGALPLPISLLSQENVEASLGSVYLAKSLNAALYGFLAVMIFMVIWYRVPGLLAVLALLVYVSLTLALFKLIPVTLTTAGIAGFVLSVGMAVDANILVFERMKEELRRGKTLRDAVSEGFWRAWTSIRDSNVSSLITSLILYWFGTSVVKGFALTLSIGILVSMFTALTVTRGLLLSIVTAKTERYRNLFLSGIRMS